MPNRQETHQEVAKSQSGSDPTLDRPPVLVLGSGITALGVVRSLGRLGIETYSGRIPGDLVRWSRWHKSLPGFPTTTLDAAELAAYLEQLPLDRAVLIPCSDPWTSSVARLDPSLCERFPTFISTPEVIDILVDKDRFRALVERLDVPHPRTLPLDSEDDLAAVPDEVFASAFLKPHDSPSFYGRYGVKAWTVRSRDEAVTRFREAQSVGLGLVCQEYVSGPPSQHVFVDGFCPTEGATHFLARRRLRMFPPDFGNSTAMVTIPLEEAAQALESLDRIFADLNYKGIFSAEFKQDERDGQFKLLEINARAWWYVEYAAVCGLPTCWLAYEEALGRPVPPPAPYRIGKMGVYPHQDLNAYRTARGRGGPGLLTVLRSWIGSNHAISAGDEPRPGMVHYWRVLKEAVARRRGGS